MQNSQVGHLVQANVSAEEALSVLAFGYLTIVVGLVEVHGQKVLIVNRRSLQATPLEQAQLFRLTL